MGLAAAPNVTTPLPLPVAPPVIEIQSAWLPACQVQPKGAVTATWPLAAPETDCEGGAMAKVQLSPERRRLKQCMLERMPTRLKRLRNVPLNAESFRIAPQYDFTEPPQEGVLHYEKSGDELNGRRWRRLAEEALRALGLAIG